MSWSMTTCWHNVGLFYHHVCMIQHYFIGLHSILTWHTCQGLWSEMLVTWSCSCSVNEAVNSFTCINNMAILTHVYLTETKAVPLSPYFQHFSWFNIASFFAQSTTTNTEIFMVDKLLRILQIGLFMKITCAKVFFFFLKLLGLLWKMWVYLAKGVSLGTCGVI